MARNEKDINMNDYYTKRCVFCLDKPKSFSGHVHDGKHVVLAGLCNEHKHCVAPVGVKKLGCRNQAGCFGVFDGRYGITEEPWK